MLNTMAYMFPAVTVGGDENEKSTHAPLPSGVADAVARTVPSGFPAVVPSIESVTAAMPSSFIHRSTPVNGPVWPAVNVWARGLEE